NPFLPKNLMIVENDDKYGVYNTDTKQLLVPLNYSYISAYHHLFYIEREEKKGVMTFEGKMLVSPIYNRINTLNDSLLVLIDEKDNHTALYYYNRHTHQKHYLPYELKGTVSPTCVLVKDESHFKLYNPFEEKVIQGDYAKGGFPDSLDLVDSKLLVTYKNGKYGLINGKGK